MMEGPPNNHKDKEVARKREKIALALELSQSDETFPFPGIKLESYKTLKANDEEFSGFVTPIDELLERFQAEGLKVVLGRNPESGNVFVLPQGSDDIKNDSLFPRHLSIGEGMDQKLQDLIHKDQNLYK